MARLATKLNRKKGTSMLGTKCYSNLYADINQGTKATTGGTWQGSQAFPMD